MYVAVGYSSYNDIIGGNIVTGYHAHTTCPIQCRNGIYIVLSIDYMCMSSFDLNINDTVTIQCSRHLLHCLGISSRPQDSM